MRMLPAFALVCALYGTATADLQVTFKTSAPGGQYAPKNIVAVWVEKADGTFVKTIGRWANLRIQYLSQWRAKAGTNDVDAVSGATRTSHDLALNAKWNLRDRAGNVMPDGNYVVRMEVQDSNGGTTNEGSFPFVKGPNPQVQSNLTGGGFTSVTLNFGLLSNTCGNGVVDPGETCEGASCVTSCPDLGIKCYESSVHGGTSDCNAECVTEEVQCVNGDGCCPTGCDGTLDSDCAGGGGGGGGDPQEVGGCSTGEQTWLPFGAVGVLSVLVLRRRRR